jgi:hypothetical protein
MRRAYCAACSILPFYGIEEAAIAKQTTVLLIEEWRNLNASVDRILEEN